MATAERFEELEVWKSARELAAEVYHAVQASEISRQFALRDQILRAAISMPANIAEGFERGGNKEFVQFLYVAKGSAGELRTLMYLVKDCGYLDEKICKNLVGRTESVSRQLGGFIQYLKGSPYQGKKSAQEKTEEAQSERH